MGPIAYETARTVIPMPNINRLDILYKDEIDLVEGAISKLESLPALLQHYLKTYVSVKYLGITIEENSEGMIFRKAITPSESLIPCILGLDAMAVEPYTSSAGEFSYFFVYYLMPIDPSIPIIVVSIVPKKDGKADARTIEHIREIINICRQNTFLVVATSGDGDTTYDRYMGQLAQKIRQDKSGRTYMDFIKEVPMMNLPFITDFLHFAKCLRRRLASPSLAAVKGSPPAMAGEIADSLNLGRCLTQVPPDAQLKDALAMNVFTLRNLNSLLHQGHLNAALYFLPIVLWRVANQALNITRESRIRLLASAFDVVRLCDAQLHSSGLSEQGRCDSQSVIFLYRQIDMNKLITSLVVLGLILMLPIDRISLSRIGTSALEHLFGVTRLGTNGCDSADRIRRLLARSFVVKTKAEERGITLGGNTKKNLAGTVDDVTKEGLLSIPDLRMPDLDRTVGAEMCSFFLRPKSLERVKFALSIGIQKFTELAQTVIDGQKEMRDTALGGFSVLPRMTAVAAKKKREKDDVAVRVIRLCSTKNQKYYSLMLYGHETIRDLKSMLTRLSAPAKEIFPKGFPGSALEDDELVSELDLLLTYSFREANKVERKNDQGFCK
jgi:hypothetical protein